MIASILANLGALCCAIYFTIFLAGPSDAQTVFADVTDQVDISRQIQARATTFGDYDNDGYPDLFFVETNRLMLYHNEGNGIFAEGNAAIQAEISPKEMGSGALFGDYDNDGDLDLFVPFGNFSSLQREMNMLLRNDRGVFVNVAEEAGLTDALPTDNAIWLDYDRDGHIDLFTGNLAFWPEDPTVRNKLYRNEGDGTFTDATEAAGLNIEFHPRFGGTHGGMSAGDFNDDGWPDLYVAVFGDRNRLFLNDGAGGFVDVTTNEIDDPGEVSGIAIGDINNDGSLEIFQGAGRSSGGGDIPFRSLLLLNLGEGTFLDVTESVNLPGLTSNPAGVNMADVDNDGDLDLLTAFPHSLFLNDGSGIFIDSTAFSGIGSRVALTVSFASYDLDGFLDVAFGAGGLWRNRGNGNHWLRVELVGVESNRNGIGSRLIATSDDLRQMREILGGLGYNQDELVAHFGLGERTQVDKLEIRWPSGQVDVLTDIPADQKIRVFEGREEYHVVEPTVWESLSDSLVAETTVDFEAAVRPALFERDAEITRVVADLSAFGGAAEVPLAAVGEGVYRLEAALLMGESTGFKTLAMMIDQATSLGNYWTKLSREIAVLPAEDLMVFDERLADGWTVEGLELTAEKTAAYRGNSAGHFQGEEKSSGSWSLSLRTAVAVDPFGYALRFVLRVGEMGFPGQPRLSVRLRKGPSVNLLERVDLDLREWQVVEIPLAAFEMVEPTDLIRFNGNIGGDFYLDDIRLVAARPSSPANTAVLEQHSHTLPQPFTLAQNYPNPFNSTTAIRFALPTAADVELIVYNLAGQQLVTLAQGAREVGTYTLNWDGRDGDGRALASGVYLYRLRMGDGKQVETRKLLLLR